MEQNIKDALRLYCEGGEDSGAIVGDINANLLLANNLYGEIKRLFESAGIQNFIYLPREEAELQKFRQLFRLLIQAIGGMRLQGMNWKKDDDPYVIKLEVCQKWIDGQTRIFDILFVRYKDMLHSREQGVRGSQFGYGLTASLSEVENDKIDANYLEQHFRQIVPKLMGDFDELEKELLIKSFSNELASLSEEQQKYARLVVDDIKEGRLDAGEKTLMELIAEYKEKSENRSILIFAECYGLDVTLLHKIYHVLGNHDLEISKLCETCDRTKVEEVFHCKWIIARARLNQAIRDFVG
jgi:type I restriction enzyme R subunit